MFTHIKHLVIKDITIEWRQKFALSSALLYVVSTVFITQLVFRNNIDGGVWNALFWIIIVFSTVSTVSRSFVSEDKGRYFYYYTLTTPEALILGKMCYNMGLMIILNCVTAAVFAVFFGSFINNYTLFFSTLLLGSSALAALLTMTGAIAWKASGNFALVAVLSFPLALPVLLIVIKLTQFALTSFLWADALKFLLILLLLNFIIIVLAYILFPFIWKD